MNNYDKQVLRMIQNMYKTITIMLIIETVLVIALLYTISSLN